MRPVIHNANIQLESSHDAYGKRVALAFGNENGCCSFYLKKECYHCDIGEGEGLFTIGMNIERLKWLKGYFKEDIQNANHLLIFNSGSVLNEKEMSRKTLQNILNYVSSLESCKLISLDSRETYIDNTSLDFILDNIRIDQNARIILGVESYSDEIRMEKLKKEMTKNSIENVFLKISKYEGRIGVDMNVIFQPPEIIGKEAIDEAVNTIKFGLDLAKKHYVPIDFNFHPYYPSKKSGAMYPNHPRAVLKDAKVALVEMINEIKSRGASSKIFIGWQDENHDLEKNIKMLEFAKELEWFKLFNIHQDIIYLR